MLLILGAVVTALSLGLYLFVSLKREIARNRQRAERRHAEIEAAVAALRKTVDEVEERAGMLVPPPPTSSGLNPGKRNQALRMHRRGDSPEYIAAALGLPAGEVQLMLKVQRMILSVPPAALTEKAEPRSSSDSDAV
jgi:hypothetical protein